MSGKMLGPATLAKSAIGDRHGHRRRWPAQHDALHGLPLILQHAMPSRKAVTRLASSSISA